MKIAHMSDLHLFSLAATPFTRLLNKRILGLANVLWVRRAHRHREAAEQILAHLASLSVDHVVITGDVSNLALESEFAAVRALLNASGLPAQKVSMVPGNHDFYTQGSFDSHRFCNWFAPYLGSDPTQFPYVKAVGEDAVVIGLCSATTDLPLFSDGELGSHQIAQLGQILRREDLADKLKLILCHHPPFALKNPVQTWLKGLRDRQALVHTIAQSSYTYLLHGHLHRSQIVRSHSVTTLGASSASLGGRHEPPSANLYTFERTEKGFSLQFERLVYEHERVTATTVDTESR